MKMHGISGKIVNLILYTMNSDGYEVKIAQFEGPFDLLLFFIERDELDIHDIPIAKLTTDFLDYLQQMQSLNMEIASEFILVAATLMRIKAKTLLPRYEAEEEEVDLKEDLIQKLIAYKKVKVACEELRIYESQQLNMSKRGNFSFDISCALQEQEHLEELSSFTLYTLLRLYDKLMYKYENTSQEVTHTVEQYPYTIETQKAVLLSLLDLNKSIDFNTVLKQSDNKVHFVYNFLALLEMLQQQIIQIEQSLGFNHFQIAHKKP